MADLLLSSGFLAFARHCGFLAAVEDLDIAVDGVCGTSSGAMTGALWASGMSSSELAVELSARPPLSWVGWSWPWRGLLSLEPVVERLRGWLPATFEELPRPLGVGVMGLDGRHHVLTSGPLPEAVAASCAMPWVFAPVEVGGTRWRDGGAVERVGLGAWRALRGDVAVIAHIIDRSHGPASAEDLTGARVIESPRSGAQLWNLGDFAGQVQEARTRCGAALRGA